MANNQSTTVIEFPRKLLKLLRCSRDGGALEVTEETAGGELGLVDASLRCSTCASQYRIENGIARLMPNDLSSESRHEIELRDIEYGAMPAHFRPQPEGDWRSDFVDAIEVPPHLEAVMPLERCLAMELGCGDGRLSILMAQLGAQVLAVDFSYAALRRLGHNLNLGVAPTTYLPKFSSSPASLAGKIGLVQADISAFHVAPSSFDRVLSATPCDSRDERMMMYRMIADSLKNGGWYIASLEYDDLNRRLLGLPVLRRYEPGGVLIEHLSIPRLRRELMPYFGRVTFQVVRAKLPFLRFFPYRARKMMSLAATKVPIFKEFSEIILARAEKPVRLPQEDYRRAGSAFVKRFYCWYKRIRGQEPIWDTGVKV